ncbi:hypothetical protein D9M68_794590 [compost metagenome]
MQTAGNVAGANGHEIAQQQQATGAAVDHDLRSGGRGRAGRLCITRAGVGASEAKVDARGAGNDRALMAGGLDEGKHGNATNLDDVAIARADALLGRGRREHQAGAAASRGRNGALCQQLCRLARL